MSKVGGEESPAANVQTGSSKNKLKGMRIRDEFLCPITYELFREPVVASDGHSYERLSIEKWLKSKTISPRTGKSMDKFLTPNLNMQKLIHDMIEEGGASLYTKDCTDVDRLFYVYAQKSLMMKCLGPPESKWNQQAFEVSQVGCLGGRRVPTVPPGQGQIARESVIFDDSTVSRIHFEVTYDSVGQHYTIRDLGSAGGTFVRIPFGKKKELLLGSMILLGKHQFKVCSIDPIQVQEGRHSSLKSDSKIDEIDHDDDHSEISTSSSLEAIVGDAEALLLALEELNLSGDDKKHQTMLIQARMQRLREAASALSSPPNSRANIDTLKKTRESKNDKHIDSKLEIRKESDDDYSRVDEHGEQDVGDAVAKRLGLTCFAPEGSPLVGETYYVGPGGASLGRAKGNSIALTLDDRVIDSSVSQEHARIEMDKGSGSFFLCDGNVAKPSTNGTWYRLSSPHQKSAPNELKPGMEILIGTVRFQATERMTITEEAIES